MVLRIWSADVVALGDRLAGLDKGQAAALCRFLADTHRIVAARVTGLDLPEPDVVVEDGI